MRKINISSSAKHKHLNYFIDKGPSDYKILIYYSFITYHKRNDYISTIPEVVDFIVKFGKESFIFLIDYLDENFKSLLLNTPNEILEIEAQFYKKFNNYTTINNSNKVYINKVLKLIFNYEKFVETKNKCWNPLLLSQCLDLSVCPYCNSQYTFTQYYHQGDKKFQIRPDLDHFFTQNAHPMLAISLYNLVPSCSICNSKLKHSKDSQLLKGIHPFIDDADKIFYFQRKISEENNKNIDFYKIVMGLNEQFDLELVPTNEEYTTKVKGFEDMYQLSERYKPYNFIINKSIKKTLLYTHNYLQSLNQAYTFKDFSKNIVRNLDEVDSIILSKVQNDIIKYEILPKMNSNKDH